MACRRGTYLHWRHAGNKAKRSNALYNGEENANKKETNQLLNDIIECLTKGTLVLMHGGVWLYQNPNIINFVSLIDAR